MGCDERKPEQIIRTTRANPPPSRGMPPMQHIALLELMRSRLENMLAHPIWAHMGVSHHILQLVAEPIRTTGLVEGSPAPEAAGQGLIQQPAIQQDIHGRVWGLHMDLSQNFIPKLAHLFSRRFHILNVLKILDQAFRLRPVRTLTEQESDLFCFPRL